jgi:hypothetical protein
MLGSDVTLALVFPIFKMMLQDQAGLKDPLLRPLGLLANLSSWGDMALSGD